MRAAGLILTDSPLAGPQVLIPFTGSATSAAPIQRTTAHAQGQRLLDGSGSAP
jgi:hypothetical protein